MAESPRNNLTVVVDSSERLEQCALIEPLCRTVALPSPILSACPVPSCSSQPVASPLPAAPVISSSSMGWLQAEDALWCFAAGLRRSRPTSRLAAP